jgi:transposase
MLSVGMAVHQASSAVAYVARAHAAHVIDRGTRGPRQAAIDHRIRHLHSKAKPLVVVYDAGPGGDWRSRSRRTTGEVGGGVAPALIPTQAGARGTTDRRAAVPWARVRRAGALTPVDVPTVDAAALRERWRARAAAIADLKAATCRLPAFGPRHDIRSPGQATWHPAHLRWRSAVVCPPPAPHLGFQAQVRAGTAPTDRLQRLAHALHAQGNAWRLAPVVAALQALCRVPWPSARARSWAT